MSTIEWVGWVLVVQFATNALTVAVGINTGTEPHGIRLAFINAVLTVAVAALLLHELGGVS